MTDAEQLLEFLLSLDDMPEYVGGTVVAFSHKSEGEELTEPFTYRHPVTGEEMSIPADEVGKLATMFDEVIRVVITDVSPPERLAFPEPDTEVHTRESGEPVPYSEYREVTQDEAPGEPTHTPKPGKPVTYGTNRFRSVKLPKQRKRIINSSFYNKERT